VKIDISIGELVDKVTILEIKLERIKSEKKIINIRNEYNTLMKSMTEIGITPNSEIFKRLKAINIKLWEIEDNIRIKEFKQEFNEEFIKLARSVYFENDSFHDNTFGISPEEAYQNIREIINEK
jgi:hypothetical protein